MQRSLVTGGAGFIGSRSRDFSFVSDVVAALLASAEPPAEPGMAAARSDLAGEAMNLGSGRRRAEAR